MSQDRTNDPGPTAESPTRTHDGDGALTEDLPDGLLANGQVLGERYQILEVLGRGGMGEVWRAFDLKLRVEVALKALRGDVAGSERHLEALRQEVRAARQVISPNVCRIYDLEELDENELVSMEYVEGQTLLDVLKERGPLELAEAQDIASQFLAGLEAIHKAGFIHRDIKPENIMVTRSGRVVVMDFGLARHETDPSRSASGTPAYMAPEQLCGEALDARADVYAAGVVLAEMVSPGGVKDVDSRKSLWEGVRSEPPKLPDSPWAPVLKKAVAKAPGQRYKTAHTLTRALEEVTLRVAGAEDLTPYPGLASFTEADAEYFFGREAEIEAVWRRLQGAHLLALVGPSGAGKTSFIGAGLVPNAPAGWAIVRCTPGNAPWSSLARAMAREMAGDEDAVQLVIGMNAPAVALELFSRWRERHDQALLIVDQFEELFTQNTDQEQRSFAALLGLLPLQSDVRVLLSMRDDFLMLCNRHEALRPVFSELTPLDPPVGAALRRALVQPATRCGYRFEDDELVEEMLAEVEGERGALPLLAFAMARLWEKRDRENGLLTRTGFHDIGGVGGALARHAEETIDRIGSDRVPIVRELFRNLVTAEGTRAVREVDDLLSVFDEGDQGAAVEVLGELIDARLLTSYEVQEEDSEPTRRVEIIHESLLANWPRLVRWQTQDQEGAQLRDELRQAARAWDEHGRHDDRLWIGTAYREFRLWQERYPGGLTEVETAFAESMTSFAGRRRRRRRMAVTAGFAVLLASLAVVGSFWRRSVVETRRAEAQKLFALARIELEDDRTASLAYATKSLELADDQEVRKLAVKALWQGPQKFVVDDQASWSIPFSPDGQRLVKSMEVEIGPHLEVLSSDGIGLVFDRVHGSRRVSVDICPEGNLVASWDWNIRPVPLTVALRSMSQSQPLATHTYEADVSITAAWDRRRLLVLVESDRASVDALDEHGGYHRLGSLAAGYSSPTMDWQGAKWLGAIRGDEVMVLEIGDSALGQPRRLGRHPGARQALFHPRGDFLVTASSDGEVRFWDPTLTREPRMLRSSPGLSGISMIANGSILVTYTRSEAEAGATLWSLAGEKPQPLRRYTGSGLWDSDPAGKTLIERDGVLLLAAPPQAEPILLDKNSWGVNIHPQSDWVSTTGMTALLWHLSRPLSIVIARLPTHVFDLDFERQGRFLVAAGMRNYWVRLWPLEGPVPASPRIILESRKHGYFGGVAVSPDGTQLLVTTQHSPLLVPVSGGPPRVLEGYEDAPIGVAFSPSGRLAAVPSGGWSAAEPDAIHIWEAATGQYVKAVSLDSAPSRGLHFLSEDHFLVATETGFMKHGMDGGQGELLLEGTFADFSVSGNGGRAILRGGHIDECGGQAVVFDLDTGVATPLASHGSAICSVAINEAGSIVVTGNASGEIRVGPSTGEQPHLLVADSYYVVAVAVDPRGRWIASSGLVSKAGGWRGEGTVRLWPMPDLSKPSLHTLPRDELIAKLKTLTNLRVVRDGASATGWTLTHDPFPGWETVPTW